MFFDPPDGSQLSRDAAYAEVESVKAVSDVYAPLSGEVVEVNDALEDAPEQINQDPYGEGWLVKVKLSDPSEAGSLLDVDAYKELLDPAANVVALRMSRYTSATDADRKAMLDAIGVGSLEDLFAEIPSGVRLQRELDLDDGRAEQEVYEELSALAARNRHCEAEDELPRRRDVRPLRAGPDRLDPPALGVPDAVHALPAGDSRRAGSR